MACQPRQYLTFDEKMAAETAFQGLPCNPKWSPSARMVYDGIVEVMAARAPFDVTLTELADQAEAVTCPQLLYR